MRRIIAWFVENSVAANLTMFVMVVGGIWSMAAPALLPPDATPPIPRKMFPEIDVQIVTVEVAYLGASPAEVENGVCVRIEEEIEGISGVDVMRSISLEGMCRVWLELLHDADADAVTAEVKNRVDSITTFPDEAEKPVTSKLVMKRDVIDVAISGDVGERTLKEIAERVRDEIAALPEVTQVELHYARPYEISIEVSEESLRRYGLRFDDVVSAVRRSSLDLPGGRIQTEGGEILLRTIGQAYRGLEFEEIVVVTRPDGTRLLLGDIATVVDGFEDTDVSVGFEGQPGLMVTAYRVASQDVLAIATAVRKYVEEARERLPEGVELTVWRDASIQLRGRLDTLFRNGRSGLALVFIVLALFLRFRLALWVTLGVPIAVLGAFATMPLFDGSIDQVTLFAFILVLGILVDDAIVVGENIYTHEVRSGNRIRASIEGTQEVAVPVIFGVLTTVAAFGALLVIPGRMGQIFFYMGCTVIACLFFSLIESQLVLPSHLSHGRSKAAGAEARNRIQRTWYSIQRGFAERFQALTDQVYRPFLRAALEWRYLSISIGLACLIAALGLLGSGKIKFSFFPAVEADYIAAQLTMPRGTPEELTRRAVGQLLAGAEAMTRELDPDYAPEGDSLIHHRLVAYGRQVYQQADGGPNIDSGTHLAEVVLELVPSEQRRISTGEIANHWRDATGEIPGAVELGFVTDLFSAGAPIDLQLRGGEHVDLVGAAADVRARLARYPGVYDITDSFRAGKREIQLEILPEAEPLGLTMQDLARQVRQGFYGEEAQRIQRGRDDVRVMIRFPEDERRSLASLENMRIRTATGIEVPFSSVARARFDRGFSTIRRTDRQRTVNVTAKIDLATTTSNEVLAEFRRTALPEVLDEYPGMTVRLEGEQRDQEKAFTGLIRAFVGALFVIYALLAIPLRSYLQPMLIMSVIPFGIVGAVLGHLALGRTFSFPSVMGIVALSGVVVNASLVMVDFVNRRRAEGVPLLEAIELSGASRFRPIVLTAVTTFVGLTPLMLERSLQAQILIPMGISLAFGVLFATAITLILVPCGTLILEDFLGLFRGRSESEEFPRPVPRRHEAA